jgi:Tfp pilus assembly protein PilN
MKPVNLLPAQHRPKQATGAASGSAYVLIGVLAALVLCVGAYVVTANRATERKDQAVEAKRETAEAERKLGGLARYGDFAQIATTRKASVATLSKARFDWERFMRELAHVLPGGLWLTGVDASMTGESAGSGSAPATTATGEDARPGATLEGCAKRQPAVATLMVRLRKLHAVEDVNLEESAKGDDADSSSGSGATSSDDCGRHYTFSVKTVFTPTPAATTGGTKRVPASLGGGS